MGKSGTTARGRTSFGQEIPGSTRRGGRQARGGRSGAVLRVAGAWGAVSAVYRSGIPLRSQDKHSGRIVMNREGGDVTFIGEHHPSMC